MEEDFEESEDEEIYGFLDSGVSVNVDLYPKIPQLPDQLMQMIDQMNFKPSSDEEEEEEDEGFSSGVSDKSDVSNDRINNFPLMRRIKGELSSPPPSGALTEGPRLQVKPDLGLSTVDRSLKIDQLMQIFDQLMEFQMTDSELQQRPDRPDHRGIMERFLADCMMNPNPSSDSGVSVKSDWSTGRIINFPLRWEFYSREHRELREFYSRERRELREFYSRECSGSSRDLQEFYSRDLRELQELHSRDMRELHSGSSTPGSPLRSCDCRSKAASEAGSGSVHGGQESPFPG